MPLRKKKKTLVVGQITKLIPQVIRLIEGRPSTPIGNTNRNIPSRRPITITRCIRYPLGTELRNARSDARGYRLSPHHRRQQRQKHKNNLHLEKFAYQFGPFPRQPNFWEWEFRDVLCVDILTGCGGAEF